MKEYSKSIESVLKEINSNKNGLTDVEVLNSKNKYGKNEITKTKTKTLLKRIIEALFEPMLIILEIACIITLGVNIGKAFKSGDGDFYECIGIVLAIVISVVLTVVMEGKSQKAFELLGKMYDTLAIKVRRNGNLLLLPQKEVVVGDIILLESGDKIIADGRLIESNNLEIDESMLTGESEPIKKFANITLDENTQLADRKNCVYSGTFVVSGSGEMVVTKVGNNTEMGEIASELQLKNVVSAPLQEKLDRLGKLVASLGGIASIFVLILSVTRLFVTNNVTFESVENAFLTSIILIVASVPEGLPTTVAIALTLNVLKLFKSNALIKKLVAAETVGCVSVICSDKTGTLTENKMRVLKVVSNGKVLNSENFNSENLIDNFALNTTAEILKDNKTIGQPTEIALIDFLNSTKKHDYLKVRNEKVIIDRLPFSSQYKFMSTKVKYNNEEIVYYKGAPEVILNKCFISESEKNSILKEISKEQELMGRVLAFSHYKNDSMHFDGYVVIADAIRKDVFDSVLECKKAGIGVKMLTGDNYDTAYSIAKQLKIAYSKDEIVNANEIDSLSDLELKKVIGNIKVVARSTPKTKLRIVKILKEMGEVVAVTGDGINDAPAIKHADIGISMGAGSEITKEASDIVLLDNSFSTIITAIAFGRNIYQNFQRFITFQLSVNVTAVLFIIISLVLGLENPFTTLQLLWINIIMDGPPALTLGLESRGYELMGKKPVKRSDNLVGEKTLIKIMLNSIFICATLICQYKYNFIGCNKEQNKTVIFALFILFHLFNAFNCRELGSKSIISSLKSNKAMLIVFFATFVLQIFFSEFCCGFFGTVSLSFSLWIKIILTSFLIVVISEVYKLIYKLFTKRQKLHQKLIKSFN